jgi:hypothetical protein
MRKPVSKHALRRALESVQAEGRIRWEDPTGAVVDRLWHHIEKQAHGQRRKPVSRDSVREGEPVAA